MAKLGVFFAPNPRSPHLAVGEVVDLLADEGDVGFGLIVRGAAGDVAVGLGQTQDGALQAHVHRVSQGGVVHFRVVAMDLIHPALRDSEIREKHIPKRRNITIFF